MRVTRDPRGYETTYLMHSARPGAPPRVLYWFRTPPGVRVGRRALDEDAIRTIEEQYPNIEFDWPTLLEEAESVPPEVERRPERPRRKPRPGGPADEAMAGRSTAAETTPTQRTESTRFSPEGTATSRPGDSVVPDTPVTRSGAPQGPPAPATLPALPAPSPLSTQRNPLLDQLVGREIASRLRARYAEITSRLAEVADTEARHAWQERADALDPDRWVSPESILHGIQHADRLFDELKQELPAADQGD
jgi:hypothetical protein